MSAFGRTSDWLADYVLEEVRAAVLPGTALDTGREGYLRLCFAHSMENIWTALERISSAVIRLGQV